MDGEECSWKGGIGCSVEEMRLFTNAEGCIKWKISARLIFLLPTERKSTTHFSQWKTRETAAFLKFLSLSVIPVLHRTVVSRNPAVNFRLLSRSTGHLYCSPVQIAVTLTDRIGGRHGIVWQLIVFRNLSYQRCRRLPVGKFLAQECMEYSS